MFICEAYCVFVFINLSNSQLSVYMLDLYIWLILCFFFSPLVKAKQGGL